MSTDQPGEGRPQFTIRAALVAMMVAAIAFGWYKSVVDAHQRNDDLVQRLMHARSEILNAKSRDSFDETPKEKMSGKASLSAVCLDGVNLRGITISGGRFQVASFKNSDLRGTTLKGTGGAFQGARFDNANLGNAKLSGDGASFQLASFAGADLSGVVLTGGSASLQGASFEGANFTGGRVVCGPGSFQSANINAAQFQGADLSAITPESLRSCYFETPPVYDGKTLFPSGFDPKAQGWTRVK